LIAELKHWQQRRELAEAAADGEGATAGVELASTAQGSQQDENVGDVHPGAGAAAVTSAAAAASGLGSGSTSSICEERSLGLALETEDSSTNWLLAAGGMETAAAEAGASAEDNMGGANDHCAEAAHPHELEAMQVEMLRQQEKQDQHLEKVWQPVADVACQQVAAVGGGSAVEGPGVWPSPGQQSCN